jgi:DNA-directed RNA polymerase subunit RPC12/RpoP
MCTPEDLAGMTEEQIYNMLLDKISYNDFAFNKEARHKYIGKKPNAFGIDKILYKCPICRDEHTLYVENDTIICKSCGFSVRVNEYYDLVDANRSSYPEDIDAWYKWQRKCVSEEIRNDSFEMTLDGSLCTLRLDKLKKPPKDRKLLSIGKARITNRGLSFHGTLDGQAVDFDFNAKSIYSLTFSTKAFLEFYHNNDYFILVPEEKDICLIKWTLASEEIHNLYDEKWRRACADVYDYDKGDIIYE